MSQIQKCRCMHHNNHPTTIRISRFFKPEDKGKCSCCKYYCGFCSFKMHADDKEIERINRYTVSEIQTKFKLFSKCKCVDHNMDFPQLSKFYLPINKGKCNEVCGDCWKDYCGWCSMLNHTNVNITKYIKEYIEKNINLL